MYIGTEMYIALGTTVEPLECFNSTATIGLDSKNSQPKDHALPTSGSQEITRNNSHSRTYDASVTRDNSHC